MKGWLRLLVPVFLLGAVFVGTTLAYWVAVFGVIGDSSFRARIDHDRTLMAVAQIAFLALHLFLSGLAAYLSARWLVPLGPVVNARLRQHLYDCGLLYLVLVVDAALWLGCREECGVLLYGPRSTWAFTAVGGILGYGLLTARLHRSDHQRAI